MIQIKIIPKKDEYLSIVFDDGTHADTATKLVTKGKVYDIIRRHDEMVVIIDDIGDEHYLTPNYLEEHYEIIEY